MKTVHILIALFVVILVGAAWWFFYGQQLRMGLDVDTETLGTYTYECEEQVIFTMTPSADMGTVVVAATGGGAYPPTTTLAKRSSDSGVMYVGGDIILTARGETVTIGEGESNIDCSPVVSRDEAPFNFGE
jgi:membrane-bound inhibitor of C-type lysozyme